MRTTALGSQREAERDLAPDFKVEFHLSKKKKTQKNLLATVAFNQLTAWQTKNKNKKNIHQLKLVISKHLNHFTQMYCLKILHVD